MQANDALMNVCFDSEREREERERPPPREEEKGREGAASYL
jgi:hypothetical protein